MDRGSSQDWVCYLGAKHMDLVDRDCWRLLNKTYFGASLLVTTPIKDIQDIEDLRLVIRSIERLDEAVNVT